jgi:hypothetical protein
MAICHDRPLEKARRAGAGSAACETLAEVASKVSKWLSNLQNAI